MTIQNHTELEGMRAAGQLAAATLACLRRATRPGITTAALDTLAHETIAAAGGRPAPALVYDFPAAVCISVNDELVHGIPGPRLLAAGDVVKLDVTVELDGFMADTACTVLLEPRPAGAGHLVAAARAALDAALRAARAGQPVRAVSRAIERTARERGFTPVRDLAGHGIGRTIHEPPEVPCVEDRHDDTRLEAGQVVAIEPMLTAGGARLRTDRDGWTIRTADGSLTAHVEHTVMITRGRPLVLTLPAA
jgi:methionyl aminopeptidase